MSFAKIKGAVVRLGSRLLPASKYDLEQSEGRIMATLDQLEKNIMATEQQVLDALAKIDAATTKAGSNLQTVADTTQTISDEIDALKAALENAGVSQSLVDQAAALGDKAQAVSDALDAHAVFLNEIASTARHACARCAGLLFSLTTCH